MSDDTLRRVMCIEDDEDIRLLLELALGDLGGYELLCCAGGEEGLRRAPEFRPQLVLLDVMMPGKNGFDVCQEVRTHADLIDLPIVLLTAKGRDTDVAKGLAMGATAYVAKPFSTKEIAATVRELLGRAA